MISIITPVFNSSKYLKETIESVLNQTYTEWELILVDGGSTDGSDIICKSFEAIDSRIKYLFNYDDQGPAHARYTGITNSKGKYIAFLDADDIWLPRKLELQINKMEIDQLHFTYTLCRELQKDERKVSIILPSSPSFSFKDYLQKRGIYALTVVIKRSLLSEDIISIWNKDSYDDTLWWLLVMKKGVRAHLIPEDLALYRLSDNQLSAKRGYTIKRVYSLYDFFPEIGFFNKNIFFINYLFDSALRHFKLKLFPKSNREINIK